MARSKNRLSRAEMRGLELQVGFLQGLLKRDSGYIEALEELADLQTQLGRVEEVVGLDERLKALRPSDPEVRYNLACSLTLSRKFEQAAAELSSALELGFNDVHSLQSDPDLADLRAHPAFRPIRARLRGLKGSAEGPSNG
jgi:tetratricopeptide (TPR) repeat protein